MTCVTESWQSGKTFDMCDRTPKDQLRFAPYDLGILTQQVSIKKQALMIFGDEGRIKDQIRTMRIRKMEPKRTMAMDNRTLTSAAARFLHHYGG